MSSLKYVYRGNVGQNGFEQLERLRDLMEEERAEKRVFDWRVSSKKVTVENLDDEAASARIFDCYGLRCFDQVIRFQPASWRQFMHKVEMPDKFVQRLHRESPDLLVTNMQHCFHEKADKYLLRLRKDDEQKLCLRGLLGVNYNRLDTIYLIDPILRLAQEEGLQVRNTLSDLDETVVYLTLPNERALLQEVDDKVLCGVRITNSDAGGETALVVEAHYERLVCTNGMTVSETQKLKAPKKLYEVLDRYDDELPPYPLPASQREEIYVFLRNAWQQLSSGVKNDLEKMRAEMLRLFTKTLDCTNHHDVRAHIDAMLYHSGLRMQRGISIEDIHLAYGKELKDFPRTHGTALLLFNAFTRYASTLVTRDEYVAPPRRRGRPISSLTFHDRMRLTRDLTGNVFRLFPDRLNWDKVVATARKDRTGSLNPPIIERPR